MDDEQEYTTTKGLYPAERRRLILELIRGTRRVDVDELVERFGVSGATIRSDLRELEKHNFVIRTHGGALLQEATAATSDGEVDPAYTERISKNTKAKIAIGRLAATLIDENDSVMIDDGSTTLQVVRALAPDTRITVLTNGLDISHELVKYRQVSVFSTGGQLNKEDLSFHGKVAEQVTARFHGSKAILGASGVSVERGITTPSEEKAELKKVMMKNSSRIIIVTDCSKINRNSFMEVCPLKEIDVLVTDDQTPEDIVAQIRAHGIEVLVAKTD